MSLNQDNMFNDFFENLKRNGIEIPIEYKNKIMGDFDEICNYEPKVGVFGKTGVGKSSLCNALFGQDICEISDVAACTRKPKEVLLSIGGSGLKLVDVPGVGESGERDDEYEELYENLLPELDLIFWVFKADDRAAASDEKFYKRLIRPYVDAGKPFLAVINQVDKIEPFREWDEEERKPGAKQLKNIDLKRSNISSFLNIPLQKVIPISANEKYGLIDLVDSIIHELPNEQKFVILDKIKKAEEINIAKAQAEAEKAQAEANKARAEAEKAQADADRARSEANRAQIETEYERIALREARARADAAESEAKNARAKLESTRKDTIISPQAIQDAEKGMWETIKDGTEKVVTNKFGETAGKVVRGVMEKGEKVVKWFLGRNR